MFLFENFYPTGGLKAFIGCVIRGSRYSQYSFTPECLAAERLELVKYSVQTEKVNAFSSARALPSTVIWYL